MTAKTLPFTPSFYRNDVGGYDVRTGTGDLVGLTAHIYGEEYAAYVAVDGERTVRLGTYEGDAAAQDALFDHVASGRPAPEVDDQSSYVKGARVYHERYGFGTIVEPIARRKPVRASVRWDETFRVTFVGLATIEVMSA
jgi:hypothetical protein